MANGIPPFLPASPPPMCNLDFYDDEEDDFGEFSNAAENCYLDDISITKSIDDEEKSNTTQVFDPGANYKSLSETLIHNKDYSLDDSAQLNIPVTHPVENESNFINENSEIDDIDIQNQNCIQNDPTEKNDSIFEAVPELNENDSCTYFKDDDSSVEDSTSDSCDKNVPKNQTNSINSNNDSYLENHVANDTIKAEHDLPPDNNFESPDSSPAVEDDFSAFCNVTEPNETVANDTISEQTKPDLQRAFSEDSDDSNTPDIDFNCFITCPPDLGNQQSDSYSLDYDDKPSEDDFGDFANPAEVDFTISHPSSSIQLHENVESVRESCLDTKSTAQGPTDQTHNLEKSLDDDFSDFVSTTELPTMESAENTNAEQNDFFDQSKSLKECQFEAGTFQISFDQANFTTNATTSSSNDLEKMYDLDNECWNEIFQGSEEEQIEVNLNTFEGKLNGSSVWCKIKDIETSPALAYNWNNSETQKILLSALYVDSRNILFGPRWNSDVPRFASNLGFSPLVPEKAAEKKDPQPISISPPTVQQEDPIVDDSASKVPASVPDAHFDWNNSGLTNPLDSRKNEKTRGSVASTYENSLLAKTPHRTELSEEAKEILNNLPNLYVMEKQYIVFPVS